jgi:hypothetical protein
MPLRQRISKHPFMATFGTTHLRLWDADGVAGLYERVFINVAVLAGVSWREIYNFNKRSPQYANLCVAIIVINNALLYYGYSVDASRWVLQPRELAIIKSYYKLRD